MLKSTHKPTTSHEIGPAPLPEGWTEHKAPTGHSYYYNAETKKSTYQRPTFVAPALVPIQPAPNQGIQPGSSAISFLQYQLVPDQQPYDGPYLSRGTSNTNRGGRSDDDQQPQRPRGPHPTDKPKSIYPIPGQASWMLVHTKLGRRFVYNSEKNQSYWRIPDKLKAGILQFDQQRIRNKAYAEEPYTQAISSDGAQGLFDRLEPEIMDLKPYAMLEDGNDSSEYEEVEVTDDGEEANDEEEEENTTKRQRLEEEEIVSVEPIEFNEDDIAFQLAAMGQDYGLEPSEYQNEDFNEPSLSTEDATSLFCDVLDDHNINPYSPWEKLISDGIIIDDPRYTSLPTMKRRKEVFDNWSRTKIALLRSKQVCEEKLDPKISYLAFLQQHATTKLYYPEFKRKFRKEAALRDSRLAEKEKEKLYREFAARKKLPSSQLKSDFLTLLKEQPLSKLNNQSLVGHLPSELLTDIRYACIDPGTRDSLIEGWISTLGAPSTDEIERDQAQIKEEEARRKRERAMKERADRVEEARRKQKRALEFGKDRLRVEEREIERAMDIGKEGLRGHLKGVED